MSNRVVRDIPWGVRFLQYISGKCCPRLHFNREVCYKSSVVFLTYISYMCYHMCRKPISTVKAVLHMNCSELTPPSNLPPDQLETWCDWAPFNGTDAESSQMLGELDSSFLFSYAAAMFVSGFIAERVDLRYFLSLGMLLSGFFCYLFGLGKTYNIHVLSYYIVVQIIAGIVQTTGWPSVVAVMTKWFGKKKRGLIFGLWNSHTSVGNILGLVIPAMFLKTDWAYSFIVPGFIMGMVSFIVFLFLVVNPSDVGCGLDEIVAQTHGAYKRMESQVANNESTSGFDSETDDTEILIGEQAIHTRNARYTTQYSDLEVQRRMTERTLLLPNSQQTEKGEVAIGFCQALNIPGVYEFSLCLFFSKLVSYTFLYWLPLYVNASMKMGPTTSADYSSLFEVGGIVGAIIAGVISDQSKMSATTCVGMLGLAAPVMFIYQKLGTIGLGANMLLLIMVGILVNGPYALITTVVSADLGTHSSLEGNSKALATVTAIIDGTGSIGAAVGPLLAGFIAGYGWQNVFLMLIASDIIAMLMLARLCRNELANCRYFRRETRERIE